MHQIESPAFSGNNRWVTYPNGTKYEPFRQIYHINETDSVTEQRVDQYLNASLRGIDRFFNSA